MSCKPCLMKSLNMFFTAVLVCAYAGYFTLLVLFLWSLRCMCLSLAFLRCTWTLQYIVGIYRWVWLMQPLNDTIDSLDMLWGQRMARASCSHLTFLSLSLCHSPLSLSILSNFLFSSPFPFSVSLSFPFPFLLSPFHYRLTSFSPSPISKSPVLLQIGSASRREVV